MKTPFIACLAFSLFLSSCKEPTPKEPQRPGCTDKVSQPTPAPVPKVAQILKMNIADEPQTLDPRKARTLRDLNLCKLFMEGLTRVNKENKAEMALAKEVQISDDQKTYTITLKESKWSNGDPLTAGDFVYAWKKTLSPEFVSDYAFQLFPLKNAALIKKGLLPLSLLGVNAENDHTLIIELENPVPYFLDLLSLPIFFPINSKLDRKNPHWAREASTFSGNGPFVLQEWEHHNKILAQKNPSYWDAKIVKLEQIDMIMVSEDTGYNLFQHNDLHWDGSPFSTIPSDAIRSLKQNEKLRTTPVLGTYWVRVNVEAAPFYSKSLRKALALAIDRQAIVEHVTQGDQIPALGVIPSILGVNKSGYFPDSDRENARLIFEQALKELNLTQESLPEIPLTYASGERNHRIAQALQQQWFETFGLRVKLQPLESKVFFSAISKQDYTLSCGSWIADYNDPTSFLEIFKSRSNGTNNTNWENSTFTSLLDKSYLESNLEKRNEILAQCESILMEEMPVIPVFFYTMLYMHDAKLRNIHLTSLGNVDLKWAYFEGVK